MIVKYIVKLQLRHTYSELVLAINWASFNQFNNMKKKITFIGTSIIVSTVMYLFTYRPVRAGDFVGKKVFLKQDCKLNPDYICHLRGDNTPSYK